MKIGKDSTICKEQIQIIFKCLPLCLLYTGLGAEEYVLDNVGGLVDIEIPPLMFISNRAGFVLEYRDYSIVDTKENSYLQSESILASSGGVISGLD